MGRYIQQTGIAARVSSDLMLRVFDRDGTGTVDATFCETCIEAAESDVDSTLNAYVGGVYLNNNGATVDPVILFLITQMTLWYGVCNNPSAQGEKDAPFQRNYDRAMKRLKALADDDHFRARTAAGFPTLPQPGVDNVFQSDGITYNQPWKRAASGEDPTGF